MLSRSLLLVAAFSTLAVSAPVAADEVAFKSCVADLRGEAIRQGVREEVFDAQIADLAPDMAVLGFLDAHRLVLANEDQQLFVLEVDRFK